MLNFCLILRLYSFAPPMAAFSDNMIRFEAWVMAETGMLVILIGASMGFMLVRGLKRCVKF